MKRHKNCRFDVKTEFKICWLYYEDKKLSMNKLAEKFGCTIQTICNILSYYEIPIRSHEEVMFVSRGTTHHSYKGGSVRHDGYRLINVDGKRVYEHRHVVEQHLGRKLRRDEHVHHINRDKLDNRIENLEIIDPGSHGAIHNRERPKKPSVMKHGTISMYTSKGCRCDQCREANKLYSRARRHPELLQA